MLGENLQEIAKVGATAVLYLLIGLSVISIGIIVERWWFFSRRKADIKRLTDSITKLLRKGDRDGVLRALKATNCLEAEVITEALAYYDDGPDSFAEIVEKAMRDRRHQAEGGLLFLGTLGNNAPFIGLFGTVLGIVHSFRELGAAQPGAAGGGNMDNVMNGIAEALDLDGDRHPRRDPRGRRLQRLLEEGGPGGGERRLDRERPARAHEGVGRRRRGGRGAGRRRGEGRGQERPSRGGLRWPAR